MKRVFAILMCVCLVASLAACSSSIEYAASNAEKYQAVLSDAGIVHRSGITGMDIMKYAMKDAGGNVYCMEYIHKENIVTSWSETIYIPIAGATEMEIAQLELDCRSKMMSLEIEPCCTITYQRQGDYYKVNCVFTNMDKEENYSIAFKHELTTEKAAISMKATEDDLIKQGYVKG